MHREISGNNLDGVLKHIFDFMCCFFSILKGLNSTLDFIFTR